MWRDLPPVFLTALAVALLWTGVTALWAIHPVWSLTATARTSASMVIGMVVLAIAIRDGRAFEPTVFKILAGSVAVGLVILIIEAATHFGVSQLLAHLKGFRSMYGSESNLKRGMTVLAVLIWPLGLMLSRRVGPALAFGLSVAAGIVMGISDSGSIHVSLAGGAIMALLVWFRPRLGRALLLAAVVGSVALMPLMPPLLPKPETSFQNWPWLPTSAHHRLTIWKFVAGKIAEKPWAGWGMESSRYMPGGENMLTVTRTDKAGQVIRIAHEQMLPLHPHNSILQWWLELGGIGAVLVGLVAVWIAYEAARPGRPAVERAALVGGFTTCYAICGISYGFWQSWWLATMWFVAMFLAMAVTAPTGQRSS
jgi:O-antigen ligase